MLPTGKPHAELQIQRTKLANSYTALLEEFSAKDLHTVGNYTLSRFIGKGSFGKVYLATHKLTNGSKVVLKSTDKGDQNLAREIHHHRQFVHPHIARLYEVIVTEQLVWLVLEYCPGDELYHYLTRNGPLDPTQVQKIFSQLVGAVAYVHSKSCVHRDLKLENILLDKSGNVKLVDFGFTREYEGKASYLQTWCGTVCYSAPEMLKGEKYAGEKVDVWSLGIILYALLCGELPFDEDDDSATKMKILREEPKYPDHMPQPAKDLITLLLSKRPILRPSLADILASPWLSDWAPQQQAILKIQQPPPFSTQLEKDVLQRMRSAGVDIDMVIEHVLSQRCDSLAGWWALLLEKEQRKERRRVRRRKERDAEARASRRISVASSRLDKLAPTIKESPEETITEHSFQDVPGDRGREIARINGDPPSPLAEKHSVLKAPSPTPMVTRRVQRTPSSPRRISQLGPGEPSQKRNSTLHVVATNTDLVVAQDPGPKKRRRRYQPPFIAQIKHWFKESAKRAKSPNTKNNSNFLSPESAARQQNQQQRSSRDLRRVSTEIMTHHFQGDDSKASQPELRTRSSYPSLPQVTTNNGSGSTNRRLSQSPSPITPQSSYRRPKSNLRGRKSTSSSVSSIRSMHGNNPTQPFISHSKASSTSSTSVVSPSGGSAISMQSRSSRQPSQSQRRGSPATGLTDSPVKVLPSSSGSAHLPSNIRVIKSPSRELSVPTSSAPPHTATSEPGSAFHGFGPPSPSLPVFARRRRSAFRGPVLGPGFSSAATARRRSDGTGQGLSESVAHGRAESASARARVSGEVIREEITEEDEDAPDGPTDGDDEYEDVEAFSPTGADDYETTFPVPRSQPASGDIPSPTNTQAPTDTDTKGDVDVPPETLRIQTDLN